MSGSRTRRKIGAGATQAIEDLGRLLPAVTRVHITARPGPGSSTTWRASGRGAVDVYRNADGDWLFQESGRVSLDSGPGDRAERTLSFRNVLRWRVGEDRVELAHQRFGEQNEVRLVQLTVSTKPVGENESGADLVSVRPHRCGPDLYHARLHLATRGFELHWRIQGPDKDEALVHAYKFSDYQDSHTE
jgi:hypothetical protein